jgi:hypothetical protein
MRGAFSSVRNLSGVHGEWLVVVASAPRQSAGCIEIMRKRHFSFAWQAAIIRPLELKFKPRRLS